MAHGSKGIQLYPFQACFGCGPIFLSNLSCWERKDEGILVDVPTGMGKTAMAVLLNQANKYNPDVPFAPLDGGTIDC